MIACLMFLQVKHVKAWQDNNFLIFILKIDELNTRTEHAPR